MKCETVIEDLSAYIDGELSAQEAQAVASHVSQCEHCRHELAELQRVAGLIRLMPVEKAPGRLADDVAAEIEAGKKRREKVGYYVRLLGPAAAAALIALAISIIYRGSEPAPDYTVARRPAAETGLLKPGPAESFLRAEPARQAAKAAPQPAFVPQSETTADRAASPVMGDVAQAPSPAHKMLDEPRGTPGFVYAPPPGAPSTGKDEGIRVAAEDRLAAAHEAAKGIRQGGLGGALTPVPHRGTPVEELASMRPALPVGNAAFIVLRAEQPAATAEKVKALLVAQQVTAPAAAPVPQSRSKPSLSTAPAAVPRAEFRDLSREGALPAEALEKAGAARKPAIEPIVAEIRADKYQEILVELAKLGTVERPAAEAGGTEATLTAALPAGVAAAPAKVEKQELMTENDVGRSRVAGGPAPVGERKKEAAAEAETAARATAGKPVEDKVRTIRLTITIEPLPAAALSAPASKVEAAK